MKKCTIDVEPMNVAIPVEVMDISAALWEQWWSNSLDCGVLLTGKLHSRHSGNLHSKREREVALFLTNIE